MRDTLCVLNLKKNLISVHHFTSQNNVYVEFHPSYFLVKEPITGAILLRGSCENDIYIFPESLVRNFSQKVANVHEQTSLDGWHKRLGHPSYPIVKNLVSTFSLPTTTNKMTMLCHSCSINKSHQQPFRTTSLSSTGPLEIIYTDVWGPTHSTGLDGSRYYLLFVDHYTKYMWFYPMATKSSVSTIFPQFKIFVETRFQAKIKTLYSDNGGEFISLKPFLNLHGISHYTTAPYTPQQNGVSERRHRHLVETGLTLLSDASLSLSYWPHAFRTATYLINRQPTPLLTNKSPFEALFGQKPNYLKLKKLVRFAILLHVHIIITRCNLSPFHVFFWAILKLKMPIFVWILRPTKLMYLGMCYLMRPNCLFNPSKPRAQPNPSLLLICALLPLFHFLLSPCEFLLK